MHELHRLRLIGSIFRLTIDRNRSKRELLYFKIKHISKSVKKNSSSYRIFL